MIIPTHWIDDDGGRSKSRRPKQDNDCTVRAIAIATVTAYDEVYDYLADCGRKCFRGFHVVKLLEEHIKNNTTLFGYKIIKHSFPAEKGKQRMNVGTFYMTYTEGRFITRQAKHVQAIVNGYAHDIFWNGGSVWRCVYTAFEFIKKDE